MFPTHQTVVLLGGALSDRRSLADKASKLLGGISYASCSKLARRIGGTVGEGLYPVLCGAGMEAYESVSRVASQSGSPVFVLDHPANWGVELNEIALAAQSVYAGAVVPTFWLALDPLAGYPEAFSFAGQRVSLLQVGNSPGLVAELLRA